MARKSKAGQKVTRPLTVMVSDDDRVLVERMAAHDERSLSSMVRLMIKDAARERGLWTAEDDARRLAEIAEMMD